MAPTQVETNTHNNDERQVECPVEGCDATPLSRGAHLHVMRSAGNGHGPQGEVPDDLDLDNLEPAGTREVSMDYPTTRETESVARLCPYCEQACEGKHGVMIHLGQVAGKRNHPEEAAELHEPDDFAIVALDDEGNIVEVVEESNIVPSDDRSFDDLDKERIASIIAKLHADGLDSEAEKVKRLFLND